MQYNGSKLDHQKIILCYWKREEYGMMLHGEQQGKIDLGNHIELKRDYLENIFFPE